MQIVDAQVHAWLPESRQRPWPAGGAAYARAKHHPQPITIGRLTAEMTEVGVSRALLVPPFFEGFRNEYSISSARDFPDRFRVMARFDLNARDRVPVLEELLDESVVAGIRFAFIEPDAGELNKALSDAIWSKLEAADRPVMLYAPDQTADIERLVQSHPDLRVAVDHLNFPARALDANELALYTDQILGLARFENVCVKASALQLVTQSDYPHYDLHPVIHRVIAEYGSSRVFWGSDWSRIFEPYAQTVDLFRNGLEALPPADLANVMGASLSRWIDWPTI